MKWHAFLLEKNYATWNTQCVQYLPQSYTEDFSVHNWKTQRKKQMHVLEYRRDIFVPGAINCSISRCFFNITLMWSPIGSILLKTLFRLLRTNAWKKGKNSSPTRLPVLFSLDFKIEEIILLGKSKWSWDWAQQTRGNLLTVLQFVAHGTLKPEKYPTNHDEKIGIWFH